MRVGDLIARLGGCRLGVACSGLDAPAVAEALAHEVVAAAAEPVVVEDEPVQVSARVGVAITSSRQSTVANADALVLQAEQAVEVARHAEGSPVVVTRVVDGPDPPT